MADIEKLLRRGVKSLQQSKQLRSLTVGLVAIGLLLILFYAVESDQRQSATHERSGPYPVVRVIDGDTIVVHKNQKDVTVRLIGIDSPEISGPYTQAECFGVEASNFTTELLSDSFVWLASDESQGDTDIYDRLLRYVFTADEGNVNELLIREGYAYEYTFREPYDLRQDFVQAQEYARTNNNGLWSADTCGGSTAIEEIKFDEVATDINVPDGCIHFQQAPNNIGIQTCVAGRVDHVFVSATDTTFINFCEDYQTCPFSSVIFADDKSNFSDVAALEDKIITIEGRIDTYRGRPQIILRDTTQLSAH